MNIPQIISLVIFLFSIVLLAGSFLTAKKLSFPADKYFKISSVIYVTGTLLIFIFYLFKPGITAEFLILAEIFVFLIHAAGLAMILFITKKFKEAAEKETKNRD